MPQNMLDLLINSDKKNYNYLEIYSYIKNMNNQNLKDKILEIINILSKDKNKEILEYRKNKINKILQVIHPDDITQTEFELILTYFQQLYKSYKYDYNINQIEINNNNYNLFLFYKKRILLLLFIFLINIIVFITIYIISKQKNYNNYILLARSSAFCILINMCLLILSVSNLSIYINDTLLLYLPTNDKLLFHKIFAYLILFFSMIHIFGHIINISYFDSYIYKQYKNQHILTILPIWSGILLSVILLILIILAIFRYKYKYSTFIGSHRIFVITFCLLVILHGVKQILGFNYSYIYLITPILINIYNKKNIVFRQLISSIQSYTIDIRGNTKYIILYLSKPPKLYSILNPAMSIEINHPDISMSEFHPFTMTNLQNEEYLTLYIHIKGKWTTKFAKQLIEHKLKNNRIILGTYKYSCFRFYLYYKYNIFICSNIGITPFIAIIKDLIHNKNKICHIIQFIWIIDDLNLLKYFKKIFTSLKEQNNTNKIEIIIYYTGINKLDEVIPNLGNELLLFTIYHYAIIYKFNFDIISGSKLLSPLVLGRPNWDNILKKTIIQHPNSQIGVFSSCGLKLQEIINNLCFEYSNNNFKTKFNFYSENIG